MISKKKGSIGGMSGAMISLVLASVILVFGIVILYSIQTTSVVSDAFRATVTNNTVTTVNEQGDSLSKVGTNPCMSFNVYHVQNATGPEVISTGNYTFTRAGVITIANAASNKYNNTNFNVSYTYTYGDTACAAANSTVSGLGSMADFWQIIVLAIVISVVIGLLLTVFGGRKER